MLWGERREESRWRDEEECFFKGILKKMVTETGNLKQGWDAMWRNVEGRKWIGEEKKGLTGNTKGNV